VIGEIQKNAMERIRVARKEYKGHEFIDVRVFYEEGGEWKPTKKGITIAPERTNELIALLKKAAIKDGQEAGYGAAA
jgi:hypothetical protein